MCTMWKITGSLETFCVSHPEEPSINFTRSIVEGKVIQIYKEATQYKILAVLTVLNIALSLLSNILECQSLENLK